MTLGEPVLPDAVEGAAAGVDAVEVSWALLLLAVSAGVSVLFALFVGAGIDTGVGLTAVRGAELGMSDTTSAIMTWPDSSEAGNSANSRCATHSNPACANSTAAMVLRSRVLEMWCR